MADFTPAQSSRRNFIITAPVAAAAGLAFAESGLLSAPASAQTAPPAVTTPLTVQKFSAGDIAALESAQAAKPGSKNFVAGKTMLVALTTETAKVYPEFEMHENRDHLFHIIEGSTSLEVGGSFEGKHSIGPGEWLAPKSPGSQTYTLNKGDMLVIPRNTPHKRSTSGTASFFLISSQGQSS